MEIFFPLQAGPQFGVLIDQNKTLLQNGGDAFKKGDFSMLAGVQVKVGAMRVTGRYAIGLNNISDIDNEDNGKARDSRYPLDWPYKTTIL